MPRGRAAAARASRSDAALLTALLLQAATLRLAPIEPERIGLLAATERRCAGREEEIVVCARRNGDRLAHLPDRPAAAAIPSAVVRLPGGGTANLHVEQATIGQTGATTKRLMGGAAFPFRRGH